MTAFASVQEFANHLQTPVVNAPAKVALNAATSRIQYACGQRFEYVVDDEIVLTGGSRRLVLPNPPVFSITSISTMDYFDLVPMSQGLGNTWIRSGSILLWLGGTYRPNGSPVLPYVGEVWPYEVRVVYTHGYRTVPDDVKGCCLMLAAEMYSSPEGTHYESIDDYASRRADADSTPGAIMLKALKARYGREIHSLSAAWGSW